MSRLHERARRGRHSIVICANGLLSPQSSADVAFIVVDCRSAPRALEPLAWLDRELRTLLGDRSPSYWPRDDLERILGNSPDRAVVRDLVDDLNRLALLSRRTLAVVFQAVQLAHPATIRALGRLITRDALSVPLFFGVDSNETESVRELVQTALDLYGPDAILDLRPVPDAAVPMDSALPPRQPNEAPPGVPDSSARLPDEILESLGPRERLVLRAAAAVGSPFEATLVGALVGMSETEVLQCLQTVDEAGVPFIDHGDGRLSLPNALSQELARGTLPSLRRAWHQRAAEILSERGGERSHRSGGFSLESAGRRPGLDALTGEDSAWPRGGEERGFDGGTSAVKEEEAPEPPRSVPPPKVDPPAPGSQRLSDAARAAEYAGHAGDIDLEIEQRVHAARRATTLGAFDEALRIVDEGIARLDAAPDTDRRRHLRVSLMAELAKVHWLAAGLGEEFSLASARGTLEECLDILTSRDPAMLRAHVLATLAGVRYDMGDPDSLEAALQALTRAQRELLDAKQPVEAARLLNDEAQVWLRIGDVVRANSLLKRSREVFEEASASDPNARAELAQTDHLLARLILRAEPRPGKESDAFRLGIEHARTAMEMYMELGRPLDVARVRETLGRLEMAAGHPERAAQELIRAGETQSELGDAIGVARTAAAFSELLSKTGRSEEALEMLVRSAALNAEKGTPQGLAFNKQSLDTLLKGIPAEHSAELQPLLTRLAQHLKEGERNAVTG